MNISNVDTRQIFKGVLDGIKPHVHEIKEFDKER